MCCLLLLLLLALGGGGGWRDGGGEGGIGVYVCMYRLYDGANTEFLE